MRAADDGAGIAPDDRGRIFDLFEQPAPLPTGAPAGLGIGLTLVRRLVEMHGGSGAPRRRASTGTW